MFMCNERVIGFCICGQLNRWYHYSLQLVICIILSIHQLQSRTLRIQDKNLNRIKKTLYIMKYRVGVKFHKFEKGLFWQPFCCPRWPISSHSYNESFRIYMHPNIHIRTIKNVEYNEMQGWVSIPQLWKGWLILAAILFSKMADFLL